MHLIFKIFDSLLVVGYIFDFSFKCPNWVGFITFFKAIITWVAFIIRFKAWILFIYVTSVFYTIKANRYLIRDDRCEISSFKFS